MRKYLLIILIMRTTQTMAQENELIFRTQTEYRGTQLVPWGQYHYKKMTLEGRFNFEDQSSVAILSGVQFGPRKLYCSISAGVLFGKSQGFMPQIKFGMNRYNCSIFSVSEYVFGLKQNDSFALHSLTALWMSRRRFGFGIEEELRYFSPRRDSEQAVTREREFAVGPVVKFELEHFFAEAWYGLGLYGNSRLHMGMGFKFE